MERFEGGVYLIITDGKSEKGQFENHEHPQVVGRPSSVRPQRKLRVIKKYTIPNVKQHMHLFPQKVSDISFNILI